jgi:hypothetical protein
VSGDALPAAPAAGDKRNGHTVSDPPLSDTISHGGHKAGKFVTGDMGEALDVGVVTLPSMPVASAESRGLDFNYNPVGVRNWIGDLCHSQWAFELLEEEGAHAGSL